MPIIVALLLGAITLIGPVLSLALLWQVHPALAIGCAALVPVALGIAWVGIRLQVPFQAWRERRRTAKSLKQAMQAALAIERQKDAERIHTLFPPTPL